MPLISIIMPSLRPQKCLQRIEEFAETNPDVDYEMIVVSPFLVQKEKVVHIHETTRQGCLYAHRIAYLNSSGEYVVWWADDASPTTNCLSIMMDFIRHRNAPFIGSFRIKNTEQKELDTVWTVYGKLYACYGCSSKESLELVGGYFDPIFKNNWADPDLSLRVWEYGGRVELCPDSWIVVNSINDEVYSENLNNYFDADTETFLNRWHNKLGQGIEKTWQLINKPVHPALALAGTTKFSKLTNNLTRKTLKILFFNPEQYLDFENEPSNYELRLPILNCGLPIEHRDYIYQRVLRAEGREEMNKKALQEVLQFNPDLVIYSTSWPHEKIAAETLQEIMNQGIPVYTHIWDTHVEPHPHEIEWALNCNYLGVADSVTSYLRYRLLAEIKAEPKGVIFTIGNFLTDAICKKEIEKIYDVTLVGSNEGQRLQLINYLQEKLAKHNISISKFGGLVNTNEAEQKIEDRWISIEKYSEIINQSKICLSSQTISNRNQIKSRVFEYLACGTLCLTDSNEELRTIVPDDCVVYYDDFDDCANKIIYYLENEEERVRIANTGYQWFYSNFNYKYFWSKFLKTVVNKDESLPTLPILESKFKQELQEPIKKLQCQTEASYCLNKLDNLAITAFMIEVNYYGYNIILYNDKFFGVDPRDGEFEFEKWKNNSYKHCIIGKTVAEVKRLINENILPILFREVQAKLEELYAGYPNATLIEDFGEYNIVAWKGDYYGLPKELGAVDIMTDDISTLKGVFVDISIERLKQVIQNNLDLIAEIERSHSEIERSQSQIQAMESSKFWKLRSILLRLKRTIGL